MKPEWNILNHPITQLQNHQVFVFGSNRGKKNHQGLRRSPDGGFHGAGAAGFAMRGNAGHPSKNHPDHWSHDTTFLAAMQAPEGSEARKGKWAVYGICKGPMQGKEGKSYAIYTVVAPGQRRSVPVKEIQAQMQELVTFASMRPHLEFLITPIGEGYAGYTQEEMDTCWNQCSPFPENMKFIRAMGR